MEQASPQKLVKMSAAFFIFKLIIKGLCQRSTNRGAMLGIFICQAQTFTVATHVIIRQPNL